MSYEQEKVAISKSTQKWINRKGISEAKKSEMRRRKRPFHDVFSLKKD